MSVIADEVSTRIEKFRRQDNRQGREAACPAMKKSINPKDLTASRYNVLGINPFQDYHDRQGRTFKVLDEGQVVRELVS
jgi:hypothetical protein